MRYFRQDHLGSIAVITDASGAVVERNAYGPWGKRRFWTNGNDDPTNSIPSQTSRSLTGARQRRPRTRAIVRAGEPR